MRRTGRQEVVNMQRDPKPYELYRHFKGMMYQVLCIATDSEDGTKQVVYQQLYSPYQIYVRPYDMFISKVDRVKYPDVTQEYRFEYISDPLQQGSVPVAEASAGCAVWPGGTTEGQSGGPSQDCDGRDKIQEAVPQLDPWLVQFLDADTSEERLQILHAMPDKISSHMLDIMEITLDLDITDADAEERILRIRDCLMLRAKYECGRLR